ncbi:Uncharacterised protein [Mycobacteroides abscessus subsp. abscessus]|nr:Uncharacterised protein [Mycobacteroides abscessus subsp. abscessus]
MNSRSYPASGTSRASIRSAVPTAVIRAWGRSRRTASATASIGVMCPAVPPPATMTDGEGFNCGSPVSLGAGVVSSPV